MKTTIVQGNKVQTLKNCRALAFTGHTNIEKCYGIEQIPEIYNEEAFESCYLDIKNFTDNYINQNTLMIKL